MPAKAGIQEDSVVASGYDSWIPGLAVLARNDVTIVSPSDLMCRTATIDSILSVVFGKLASLHQVA